LRKFIFHTELLRRRYQYDLESNYISFYNISISLQSNWELGYECNWYDGPWESFKIGPITIAFGQHHWWENNNTLIVNKYSENGWLKRMSLIDWCFDILRMFPSKEMRKHRKEYPNSQC
jgi:hypothetical protein